MRNSPSSSSSSYSTTPNPSTGSTSTGSASASSKRHHPPPQIVVISPNRNSATKFDAHIAYAPLRRNSMTKLDIVENILPEKCQLTVDDFTDQQIHHKKSELTKSMPSNLQKRIEQQYALPTSLAESQVVREKPNLQTRLMVCFLSGCVVLFCLIKLFYWK